MTIAASTDNGFGATYVVEPRAGHPHTHTAVLLHGRGSTGEEFAEELFEMFLSHDTGDGDQPTLADRLPTWRWVFPSSPSTWNATFEEWMPAWFEAHSLADPTARQDLQPQGLRASVQHVTQVVDAEAKTLQAAGYAGNVRARLVLGGISLGGAVALWTLLSTATPEQPLGGFAVASTWLPFAKEVEACLAADGARADGDHSQFVWDSMEPLRVHLQRQRSQQTAAASASVLETPVFVGHGRDDAYVDLALGRQVLRVLAGAGFAVEWHEYEGAEQEGHWIKEPEEVDDLARFFSVVGSNIRGL